MFHPLSLKQSKEFQQSVPTLLIPFREQLEQKRGDQLKKFCNHMKRWHPDWLVIIIEQSQDNKKFNRGALLNIGTRYAHKLKKDYIIYHDVDLIPLSAIASYYTAFPEKPIHIGGIYKDKYQGDNFIGQAFSISMKDVIAINGFPNNFWGWGGEDDAMLRRLKKHKMEIYKPIETSGYKVLEHKDTRLITNAKNMTKWEDLASDKGKSGLSNIQWKILDKLEDSNIIKISIEIL
jgi:hypothetical protein